MNYRVPFSNLQRTVDVRRTLAEKRKGGGKTVPKKTGGKIRLCLERNLFASPAVALNVILLIPLSSACSPRLYDFVPVATARRQLERGRKFLNVGNEYMNA